MPVMINPTHATMNHTPRITNLSGLSAELNRLQADARKIETGLAAQGSYLTHHFGSLFKESAKPALASGKRMLARAIVLTGLVRLLKRWQRKSCR